MKNNIALSLILSLVAGSLLVITARPAEANYKNRVNKRQTRQQSRLYNGASNGALTGREYRHLQKQQVKLAKQEARFRHSGNGLTKKEAAKLEVGQDALSKNIYSQKHDGQTKP
jgi:hypothetical protein